MKLWQHATGEPWAMTAPALQNVLDIAARKMGTDHESIDAIATRVGHDMENTHAVTCRDGVAVIPVVGPLFRYANLFTRVSGATSYEILAQDIRSALDDNTVTSLVLTIDSPGGEVNGCAELAQLIFDARDIKPIIAYVSGDAASGAYWIASACNDIIISPTSALGSIGVVAVYRHQNDEREAIEIVSSQSPNKRLDVRDESGRAKIQTRIDALGDVFVSSVANYRNVDKDTVINEFGAGDVFIGRDAVEHGLADRIGAFEKVIDAYQQPLPRESNVMSNQEPIETPTITPINDVAALTAAYPDLMTLAAQESEQQGINKGIEQERERIGAILNADQSLGREALAKHFAFATDMSVEAALGALAVSPVAVSTTADTAPDTRSGFEQVMASIENPAIEPAADQEPSETDTINATAQRIANLNQ